MCQISDSISHPRWEGCRFSIGLRNSHEKSMRLALTCGYRVFVCSNMAVGSCPEDIEFSRVARAQPPVQKPPHSDPTTKEIENPCLEFGEERI